MNELDKKEVRSIMGEVLQPLFELIEEQNGKFETLQSSVTSLEGAVTSLQGSVTSLQGSVTSLQGSVVRIENELQVYGDMYKLNRDENRQLGNRVDRIENHLGVS
ncbi:MAG: hypothetical protein M3Q44_03210 [bacterium]|nr:hypothetical protein [bacterium]